MVSVPVGLSRDIRGNENMARLFQRGKNEQVLRNFSVPKGAREREKKVVYVSGPKRHPPNASKFSTRCM